METIQLEYLCCLVLETKACITYNFECSVKFAKNKRCPVDRDQKENLSVWNYCECLYCVQEIVYKCDRYSMVVSATWCIQYHISERHSPEGEGCISHTAYDCHAICITYPKGGANVVATDDISFQCMS